MPSKSKMLNISANRADKKYSKYEMGMRFLWAIVAPIFRNSPRTAFNFRNAILRCLGAHIGTHVHIYASANIYFPWNLTIGDYSAIGEWALIYNLGHVSIGARSTISHRAHLCAGSHDYNNPNLPLLKCPIKIGNQVWVCADAFVGPGTSIDEGAVVGAASVVVKDVSAWSIVAGNPARVIGIRSLRFE